MCVYLGVCGCGWERERERERKIMSVYDREHKGVCDIGTSVCTFWREKEIETQAVWPDAVMKSRLKMFYCLIVPKKCKYFGYFRKTISCKKHLKVA